MAVTIVRPGALPGEQRYRKCCGHCSTIFEFQQKDARHHHSPDVRDSGMLEIQCPFESCGKVSFVLPADKVHTPAVVEPAARLNWGPGIQYGNENPIGLVKANMVRGYT